jgi:hypothetical protein
VYLISYNAPFKVRLSTRMKEAAAGMCARPPPVLVTG